jgi:uncharacterized protein (TIGR00251 family)
MIPLNSSGDSITFSVKLHPRAKKNAITGTVGDALKLSLTAPPVDGKANEACIRFFAELFGIPKANVSIASGATSRTKIIRVSGVAENLILAALVKYL